MSEVKVMAVGNSCGVLIPKEVLARLNVDKGDKLYVIETSSGIELSKYDPEFAKQMDMGKEIIKNNRNVLKKLAE